MDAILERHIPHNTVELILKFGRYEMQFSIFLSRALGLSILRVTQSGMSLGLNEDCYLSNCGSWVHKKTGPGLNRSQDIIIIENGHHTSKLCLLLQCSSPPQL